VTEVDCVPRVVRNTPIFNSIYNRLHVHNRNYLGLHAGSTGSGKSWGGLTEAYAIDRDYKGRPRFDIDKVIFMPSEFLKWVRSKPPIGSFVVWDEAGVGLGSREWYNTINRLIVKVLTTFRFQQLGVIFTTPALNNIDKQARQLFHSLTVFHNPDPKTKKSFARFEWIKYNGKNDKFYFPFPRYITNNHTEILKGMYFPKPPKELVEAYEKKKQERADNWYMDYEGEINLIEREIGKSENKKNSLEDLADRVLHKGIENFIDRTKLLKGQKDVSGVLLQVDLNITKSQAADLRTYLNQKILQNVIEWPADLEVGT